ncbi:1,3-beta-glucan synthase subunit FKS1, domain-1-domain-containing protein [Gautieria morchelliformis]|nr:1,3-beta-glucan synthase subunit FKS1, domain-1-domain-containing protein [Gautieria morchelliformis]
MRTLVQAFPRGREASVGTLRSERASSKTISSTRYFQTFINANDLHVGIVAELERIRAYTRTATDFHSSPTREPYAAWTAERQIPLSKEEIEDIFLDLTQKFGFQRDSMRNMVFRLSHAAPRQPCVAQLDLDDAVGAMQNPGLQRLKSVKHGASPLSNSEKSLQSAHERWRQAMNNMSQYDGLHQLALYLLCWGEAAQCQNRIEPVPEGLYLRTVIKPLYRFVRDQGYEVVEGKFVRRERDHDQIIGYDDVNQMFWYPEGIARILLNDKTQLVDVPPAYFEKHFFLHLLVNFNQIWVVHISLYWFYTAFNSPTIYSAPGSVNPTAAMSWSATALGGAVATTIMICATVMEFSYIPTTWNNTAHLTRRLIFLFVVLALTTGPTIYIALFNNSSSQLPLILGIVQFFIGVAAVVLFSIMPSGRMFGDRVAGKSRKYLASQTFTASYAEVDRKS